jgi:hypothetical protein
LLQNPHVLQKKWVHGKIVPLPYNWYVNLQIQLIDRHKLIISGKMEIEYKVFDGGCD